MEEKLNIFKKILLFLQQYTETKFGSGVVGFLLCLIILYYGVVKNQSNTIESYRLELKDLRIALYESNKNLITIREEVRKESREEQRVYFDYVFQMVSKMQSELDLKKLKTEKEIEYLHQEIKKRKELIK